MILLDTNAFIWLEAGHPRAAPLGAGPFALSPASVLELAYLVELGKLRPSQPDFLAALGDHPFIRIDNIHASPWFLRAATLTWTRDPFDRLIAAHALHRGWKLATGDARLVRELGPEATIAL